MMHVFLVDAGVDAREVEAYITGPESAAAVEAISVEQLSDRLHANRDIELVVLGTSLPGPVRVAQIVHSLSKSADILVLCRPDNFSQIKSAFRFAPLIGSDISCEVASTKESTLASIRAAFERRRRRQFFDATLASVNRQFRADVESPSVAVRYLNHILDFAPIGIIHFDTRGRILTWNRSAARLLGREEYEVLGTHLDGFLPGAAEVLDEVFVQAAEAQPQAITRTIERHLAPGGIQYISLTVVPLVVTNQPTTGVALLADSSEQIIAERMRDELLDRERQARMAAETAKERITLLSAVGTELNSSLDLQTMLGNLARVLLTTLADWCIIDLIDGDSAIRRIAVAAKNPHKQAHLEEMQARFPPHWNSPQPAVRVMQTGQPAYIPVTTRSVIEAHTSGAEHTRLIEAMETISCIAVPLMVRGRVTGAVTIARTADSNQFFTEDDLLLAQEIAYRAALAVDNALLYAETNAQREQLQVTLSSIGDAVVATDQQGYVTFLNRVAEMLTGWTNAEAIGQPLEKVFVVIDELTRERIVSPVIKVIRSGEIVDLANHTLLLRKDGVEIPISDSAAPIFNHDRQLLGVVLVFRDVTQERQARQRLSNLQRVTAGLSRAMTMEDVVNVIDRQVLNLMNAAQGWLALLDDDHLTVTKLAVSRPAAPPAGKGDVPLPDEHLLIDVIRSQEALWIERVETAAGLNPLLARFAAETAMRSAAILPLTFEDRVVGCLSLGFADLQIFDEETSAYLESMAEQCAQAIIRVQLSKKAQDASALEERHRLARELHDAVSQTLFATTMMSDSVLRSWKRDPEKSIERLNEITVLNRAALGEMRTLLLELRPETILRNDLNQLMRQLLDAARGRQNIDVELILDENQLILPPDVHLAFYRIAQEAISNVVKHSRASKIYLQLKADENQAWMCIRDDGYGFDTRQNPVGMGLGNMKQRAVEVGAVIDIASETGNGTAVTLRWTMSAEGHQT